MSQQTINRIAVLLERQFDGKIDMSDWDGRPDEDRHTAFLSRALAALTIKALADVDADVSGATITDGYDDGGIDALYFDQATDTFYVVQSKWSSDGSTPMSADKVGTFVSGLRDLLNMQLDRFNKKIKDKTPEITAALYSERPINFVFATVQSAAHDLAPYVKRRLDDFVEELNDPVTMAESQYFSQVGVYDLITSESTPPRISLQIGLHDWGAIDRPYLAYYGRVHVSEIAQWWRDHNNSLFSHNLRLFYRSSDVNDAIKSTLDGDFENFWYFNNGVTVICDDITKSAVGAPGRQIGIFTCDNASIVNGAQTVGTIGTMWSETRAPEAALDEDAPTAWVHVKIISLQRTSPAFKQAITRAANLQNRVGNREFAAMDPMQHRIAKEFALDQRQYAYKQGDVDPKGESGCSIEEATQALACAHSIELAVQVKREISALWANTNAAPYTELFNDNLASEYLWRCILIMRSVDHELQTLKRSQIAKADFVSIHLNRLIAHLVFQNNTVRSLNHDNTDIEQLRKSAREETARVFHLVCAYVQNNHENEYIASLAKNSRKCTALVENFETADVTNVQGKLL